MRLHALISTLFATWLYGVWLLSLSKQCGHTQGRGNPNLNAFITTASRKVPKTSAPLCVIEVGSADDSTMALNDALHRRCVIPGGRSFDITSYEGIPELAKVAADLWIEHDNVHILSELMITEENIHKYVSPVIDALDDFPGRSFYERLYASTKRDFFHTPPACGAADLVLIDGTRYAHAGIMATLLNGLTHADTVYVIEDNLNVRAELDMHWRLRDVVTEYQWISFRIDGQKP